MSEQKINKEKMTETLSQDEHTKWQERRHESSVYGYHDWSRLDFEEIKKEISRIENLIREIKGDSAEELRKKR